MEHKDKYNDISEKIKNDSSNIVLKWLSEIKKNYQIDELEVFPTDDLLDGVPVMIEGIARVIKDIDMITDFQPGGPVYSKAQELGELRESQGFKVDQVINEYIFLKDILMDYASNIAKEYKIDQYEFSERIIAPLDKILVTTIETYVDRYSRTLQYLAITDDLTKIRNHRFFIEQLDLEIKRTMRYKRPLTLLMIDLDNFKHYNDAYGHLSGDEVLKQFAKILENSCRSADVVARYGGDEFAVILPNTDVKHANIIAQRIVDSIQKMEYIAKTKEGDFPVDVSIGLTECSSNITSPDDMIKQSDEALYMAKKDAHKKIVIFKQNQ